MMEILVSEYQNLTDGRLSARPTKQGTIFIMKEAVVLCPLLFLMSSSLASLPEKSPR